MATEIKGTNFPPLFPGNRQPAPWVAIRPVLPATTSRLNDQETLESRGGSCVRYQMVLKILDEAGTELGALAGDETGSAQSAAKNVLHKHSELRDDAGRLKKPVDLSDELKGAARRFGA